MTLLTKPLTSIGDAALLLIEAAVEEHKSTTPTLAASGRISRSSTALGTYDIANSRAQAYFFRVVSILEAYTDAALEVLFHRVVPSSQSVATMLLEGHLIDATQRWTSRKESFNDYHGIGLGTFPEWAQVWGMVDVRNSIAHGLGALTRQQRKSASRTAARFRQIGVRIDAGQVVVSETDLDRAAKVAETFIRWIDAQL